jgi:hypothetical protein
MAGRARDFNLPRILHDILLRHCDWNALPIMHNDAIVQGLSEVRFIHDIKHWGVLTIGPGVGNAHFTNRRSCFSAISILAIPFHARDRRAGGKMGPASRPSGTTRRHHVDLLVERISGYLFSNPGGKHDLLTFLL